MRNAPETRASLLIRLRDRHDERAWQDFLLIYQPVILEMARHRGLQTADSHDLLQEVLAKVVQKLESWDQDPQKGSFRGWLARVTKNLVVDHFRSRAKQPASLETAILNAEACRDDEALFDIEQRRQLFRVAAERCRPAFSSSTWEAFWRTAVDCQPVTQVAIDLGISTGAVYIARSRVMARLKRVIGEMQFDSHTQERQLC